MQVPSLDLEDPQRRKWQPTPVFLLGEFHRKRTLAGYSPRCCKESDTTERTCTHTLTSLVVQLLSRVQLFAAPWTAALQASRSFTISWSLLKLFPVESVMPSNHVIL